MSNAIVSLAIGEDALKLLELTGPTIDTYARKVDADFHLICSRDLPESVPIMYEKLQVRQMLEAHERILYLDTDIVVRKHCPNLFDLVPPGWFAAFSEGMWNHRAPALMKAMADNWITGVSSQHPFHYFNAGVMLFGKSHQNVFDPPSAFHSNFGDQTWLNCQVNKYVEKFVDLGIHFNRMSHYNWGERDESFIIHYAGSAWKNGVIEADLERWK